MDEAFTTLISEINQTASTNLELFKSGDSSAFPRWCSETILKIGTCI
jgi:hypothetical protein